jgi:hypothetical protein
MAENKEPIFNTFKSNALTVKHSEAELQVPRNFIDIVFACLMFIKYVAWQNDFRFPVWTST